MKPLIDYRPALVNGQGIGRYVRELTRALVTSPGIDAALFAPTWARPMFDIHELGVDSARVFRRRVPSKGVTRTMGALGLGVERLFRGGAELCHHTQYRRLPTRLPEVAMVHDLVFLDTDRYMASATAERMSAFVRSAAKHARAITTPSETVADQVAERLGVPRSSVFATPLGVDHLRMHSVARERPLVEPRDPAPYILTAARIETRKNLPLVLRAFEGLDAPGLRWKVAGISGDGAEAFDEALRRSPARDRVDRLGHVSEGELRRLVLGALGFVLVPLDEGFGLAPLEAMALGVPAISSRVPVVSEVCGGGAQLVDPHDDEELKAALGRLAGDPMHRQDLARRGREHAQAFTWKRTAERTLEAYQHAL